VEILAMPRPPKPQPTAIQQPLLDLSDSLRTAIAVPAIRQEVRQWQAEGNPGITPTTKKLLAWWFKTDHRTPQGGAIRFYPAQRDAIETLIYLFEVKQIHTRADLLLTYAKGQKVALPTRDDFARYALKMATDCVSPDIERHRRAVKARRAPALLCSRLVEELWG
jgi:hypothetical protein